MATRTKDNTVNQLAWIGIGIIVLPPVVNFIKGIFSPIGLAGDILQTPEKVATAFNRQFNRNLHDSILEIMSAYTRYYPYRPDLIEHQNMRGYIQETGYLSAAEKRNLLNAWDERSIEKMARWVGSAGAIYTMAERIMRL